MPGYRGAESRALGDYLDVTARFHKDLGADQYYPVSMTEGPYSMSARHSGLEQTKIYDGLGFFGQMSNNEKRLAVLGGAALGGFLLWKHFKGRR